MSYKGPRALCMIKIPTFDVSSLCWRTFSSNFLSTLKILSQYFSLSQSVTAVTLKKKVIF